MLSKKLGAAIVFLAMSALYLGTMCPTVYTMDSGELIVAAYKLQIAHPTGYPLFCILGKLATILIPVASVAWRINAMNALIAAGAVTMLFVALSETSRRRTAAFVAVLFGISPLFWDAATSAEIHALTGLLLSVELFLFFRWKNSGEKRLLVWLAGVAGLSLTNHLTAALILPGIAIGVFLHNRKVFTNPRLIFSAALAFLLPLLLYLYIPIRAAASSGTIWGSVYQATGFIGHVTGSAFRSRMFSASLPEALSNIVQLFKLVLIHFPPFLIWLLPIGMLMILLRQRAVFAAMFAVIVLDVAYSINYAIPDIEPYYLPTMIALSVCAAFGIDTVMRIAVFRQMPRLLPVAMAALVVGISLGHFSDMNKRHSLFVIDYARNTLGTVDPNALLIACGDATYNGVRYLQVVENFRPDVLVIERNIVKGWISGSNKWIGKYYFQDLCKMSPALTHSQQFSKRYSKQEVVGERLLAEAVATIMTERPVYIACTGGGDTVHAVVRYIERDYTLVPEGALFRVYTKAEAARLNWPALIRYNERLWSAYSLQRIYDNSIRGDDIVREIPNRYALFHTALGQLESSAGMTSLAIANFEKALSINGEFISAKEGLKSAQKAETNGKLARCKLLD